MKLVIHIPCLNEEATLPLVLESIPKSISGVDEIIVLVTDDGSTDETVAVARRHGVKHFVRHSRNQGLGRSFHDGINKALELNADIVVNTDGDNQYPQNRIADLVQPILNGKADIVIADRQTHTISHFSWGKKLLQRLGSAVVNKAAGTQLPDAVSGFRAYSRESLMHLNTVTRFSYCTETIIQAGNKGLAIASIPVETNPKLRESRLFKSTTEHVLRSAVVIIRAFVMYRPNMIFGSLAVITFILGLVPFARFTYLSIQDGSTGGHIQSLLVGSLLMITAFLCLVLNIIADLIRINRILIEDTLEQTKRQRYG
ncbi:glycosyl transferase [Candidatus Saccharibacteria bacterium CG_4_10_14_0_2_um_filter_52_9]|nr:MAG: glycosyl transferase [Candidatus Saccharibacteria bacterium CG_4_10_14_0_2_um_filter_52_9]